MNVKYVAICLVVVGIAAGAGGFWAGQRGGTVLNPGDEAEPHHDDHGTEEVQVELSPQAQRNLDLKTGDVTRRDYWRTITIPAIVSERPGHSEYHVGTTVHGVISRIHVVPGQTVLAGDSLFEVQITGELIAGLQADLLKTLQDLDLVTTEIKRIEPLIARGDIPGIRGIEKKYEQQRLESQRLIQMQELMVRGFSMEQVAQIAELRQLIRTFVVRVPGPAIHPGDEAVRERQLRVLPVALTRLAVNEESKPPQRSFSVERIAVFPGKLIKPGDELCELAVHDELALAGLGFQRDSELIARVLEQQWPITAVFEAGEHTPVLREGMKIQYADNIVDAETRLFKFYLPLDNEVVRDTTGPNGVTYRSWRFKPGQRAQLLVPIEHWTAKIVLPTDAVVKEGVDAFVFRQNGKLFERIPVVIEYEDGRNTILTNESQLTAGDVIAMNEAYQLNLALKKSQGSSDPHAGHDHAH